MALNIHVLTKDRHNSLEGLNRLLGSQSLLLIGSPTAQTCTSSHSLEKTTHCHKNEWHNVVILINITNSHSAIYFMNTNNDKWTWPQNLPYQLWFIYNVIRCNYIFQVIDLLVNLLQCPLRESDEESHMIRIFKEAYDVLHAYMIGKSRKNALYFAKYIDFFQTQFTQKVLYTC